MIPTLVSLMACTASMLVGYFIGKRAGRTYTPPEKDISVCSCTHPYSKHTKDKGKCQAEVFFIDGLELKTTTTCRCVNYDGVPPAHIFMNYKPKEV